MEVDSNLKKLADEFNNLGKRLYIVGGYVRDSLLNLTPVDIDLASNLDTVQLEKICKKLKFKCIETNQKLGTMQISIKDKIYEYTRFRRESYTTGHSPNSIEFIDDINIDASRRDTTINAIYYDIIDEKIIDPMGGVADLKKQIIKTPNDAEITLADDGLRILRLIRFAITFGFKIEKKTLRQLILNTSNLRSISKERILKELKMLVTTDLKYVCGKKELISLLNRTNVYPYIFNSTLDKMPKIKNSLAEQFYKLSTDARLIGFYILILKTFFKGFVKDEHLAFYVNSLLGLDGLKESNENIRITSKLYKIYQNLNYGLDAVNATINYLSLSNTERNIVEAYLNKKAKYALSVNISYIKSKKLPLGVQDLDVSPEDLIEAKIERKYISKILSTLYNLVIECKVKNSKEDLVQFAKDIDRTFKEN